MKTKEITNIIFGIIFFNILFYLLYYTIFWYEKIDSSHYDIYWFHINNAEGLYENCDVIYNGKKVGKVISSSIKNEIPLVKIAILKGIITHICRIEIPIKDFFCQGKYDFMINALQKK